jgi:hypothetical protein
MKRLLISLLAAVVAACALVAATSAAPSPSALQRQINALKNRVNQLEDYVDFLDRCDTVIPITRFGTSTQGYLYGDYVGGILTTALDYDDENASPQYWVLVSDPSCVQTAARRAGYAIRVNARVPHGWVKER